MLDRPARRPDGQPDNLMAGQLVGRPAGRSATMLNGKGLRRRWMNRLRLVGDDRLVVFGELGCNQLLAEPRQGV